MRRSSGKKRAHSAVTTSVQTPPAMTAGSAPSQAATTPARKSPNSLEVPTNSMCTALTRPRMSSGVPSCTMVERTHTLIMSAAPMIASAAIDSAKLVERPKASTAAPNTATPRNIALPRVRQTLRGQRGEQRAR